MPLFSKNSTTSGSGQSEDEENERRLLAQLQAEQRSKLRAQQQLIESQRHAAAAAALKREQERTVEDELAPEVPVRRSSRATERSHPPHQQQPHRIHQQQQTRSQEPIRQQEVAVGRPFDPRRELPRPLLSSGAELRDDEQRSGQRQQQRPGKWQNIGRPSQPPPPPPPPLPPKAAEPAATTARVKAKAQAPKNIWSPSTSSVTTGSPVLSLGTPDEAPAHSFDDRPKSPGQQSAVSSSSAAHGDGQRARPQRVGGLGPVVVDMSSPGSQNTIVERRHLASEQNDNPIDAECEGRILNGESARPGELAAAAEAAAAAHSGNNAAVVADGAQNQQTGATNHNGSNQRNDHDDDDHGDGSNFVSGVGGGGLERGVSAANLGSLDNGSKPAARGSGESRQGERGATPVEQAGGWRSMSVSLKSGDGLVRGAARSAAQQSADARHLRSFSIATSTLPAASSAGAAAAAKGAQQRNQQLRQRQPTGGEQGRYWTLPSGGSVVASTPTSTPTATAEARPAKPTPADSCEATRPLDERRPTQQQQQQQQQEQLYSTSSKRKSADIGSGQKQPKHKQQNSSSSSLWDQNVADKMDAEESRFMRSAANGEQQQLAAFNEQQAKSGQQSSAREEWFKQMYKQMHTKPSSENTLLKAVCSQPLDESELIEVKLKSPKRGEFTISPPPRIISRLRLEKLTGQTRADHHFSPTYYASEEDFERRHDRSSVSPTFKPGNISDYLPGQSSISQHERNLVSFSPTTNNPCPALSSVSLSAFRQPSANSTQLDSSTSRFSITSSSITSIVCLVRF